MRIAQIAPLHEAVPPRLYGGTERIVSYLTEELVREGHDVTLFASADSVTSACLVSATATALRLSPDHGNALAHHFIMLKRLREMQHEFDIVHFHTDYLHYLLLDEHFCPHVTTMHGRQDLPELAFLYESFGNVPLVSISRDQQTARPAANWIGTVYHGLPEDLYRPLKNREDYLVFLGRISPEKRVDRAIEIAGRAGRVLRIAAKVDRADLEYFNALIKPLLALPHVEFLGEVSDADKNKLLGRAHALVFPIDWPEPFGIAMIEAMACGTPVVAWRKGSAAEVIDAGESGYLVNSIEMLAGERTLRMRYEGRDGLCRVSALRCSRPMEFRPPDCLHLTLRLEPQQYLDLHLDLHLLVDGDAVPDSSDEAPLNVLQREIAEQKGRIAAITTSNDQFNRWMERSRTDLVALLARKDQGFYPYAGVPWYNSVFGRDGLITGLQTLLISPWVARDVLLHLARLQATQQDADDPAVDAEPGKILHELREGELVNLGELPFKKYYGSADSTPLFIWLAGLYAERTADHATIDRLWPHLQRAMDWIDQHSGYSDSGFATYLCRSEKGLRNQGWKDSHDSIFNEHGELVPGPIALCEVQGYIYQAKVQMARLATERGEYDRRETLLRQAAELRTRFNREFWDEELGFVVMARDGNGQPCRVISSNPGHCMAAGILDADKARRMAARFMEQDLHSGWGIRTLSSRERRYNPMSYHNGSVWAHDTSIVAMGLARYGHKDEVQALLQSLFDATLFLDLQRVPELFCGLPRRAGEGPTEYPVACSPQAWAVCAGFMMMESMLGIRIVAQRREVQLESPRLGFLSELRLSNIWLSPHERISLRFINYQSGVGVEVIDKPTAWNVIIRK